MTQPVAPGTSHVSPVDAIRDQFPALRRGHRGHAVAYFDGPGGTQIPAVVVDRQFVDKYPGVQSGAHVLLTVTEQRAEPRPAFPIAVPDKDKACPQVRPILGKEFPLPEKPQLPVQGCVFATHCECHYVKLFDRRKGERRSGKERRQLQRFEDGKRDRRSGKDRRKNRDVDWV